MAVTTTLSRLKNYFIGWHTANYRTLHEFTDQITEDEPDGSKLVESKTIFQYINDIITPIKDKVNDLDDNIGNRCIPRHGETLWENICNLWSTIGEWASPDDPKWESFWNLERTDNSDWNPIWENGVLTDDWPKGWTVKGWIRKIWYEILKVQSPRISNLETRASNLENNLGHNNQTYIVRSYGDTASASHCIIFYRHGWFVFVRGYISPDVRTNADAINAHDQYFIQGNSSYWDPIIPASSVYLNFNTTYGSATSAYVDWGGGQGQDHHHTVKIDKNTTKNTSSVSSYHKHMGVNSIELNVGTKMGTGSKFALVATIHGSNGEEIYFSGMYLAKNRYTNYGNHCYDRERYSWNDATWYKRKSFNSDWPGMVDTRKPFPAHDYDTWERL